MSVRLSLLILLVGILLGIFIMIHVIKITNNAQRNYEREQLSKKNHKINVQNPSPYIHKRDSHAVLQVKSNIGTSKNLLSWPKNRSKK